MNISLPLGGMVCPDPAPPWLQARVMKLVGGLSHIVRSSSRAAAGPPPSLGSPVLPCRGGIFKGVHRAEGQRLERVDWQERPRGNPRPAHRPPAAANASSPGGPGGSNATRCRASSAPNRCARPTPLAPPVCARGSSLAAPLGAFAPGRADRTTALLRPAPARSGWATAAAPD